MSFYSVVDYGAVGDGKTLNTEAFQRAIDAAAGTKGGVVYVPEGTFLTGTVFLKTGIALDIHPAGRILGSPNMSDYKEISWGQHIDRAPWHLIVATGEKDITIRGGGTIDGNGPAFWEPCVPGPNTDPTAYVPPGAFGDMDAITCVAAVEPDPVKAPITWIHSNKERRPSPMIEITGCNNIRIENVHITNSAGWLLHLHNSDFVWVKGVKLVANLVGPNNDGFDITGCRDVMISDCYLSCCDDAICFKTTPDSRSCERLTVSNCVIRTKCAAIKFGCSETYFDFRQVTVTNCVVFESSRAIALYMKRGATIEDVTISNIVCDTRTALVANRPIQIDCCAMDEGDKLGKIRNVIISNVVCRTDGRILLVSDPDSPLENIVLRDIQMIYPTVDDPALLEKNVSNMQLAPHNPDARKARGVLVAENIDGLVVDNLIVKWPELKENGEIDCPEDWRFDVKAANGAWATYYEREQFNTGHIPDFHVAWARGVKNGHIRAPLARPPRDGLETYHLEDCEVVIS